MPGSITPRFIMADAKSIVGHGMLSRSHLLHHEHGQPHKSKSVAEIFGHKSRSNYPQILRKICREEKISMTKGTLNMHTSENNTF